MLITKISGFTPIRQMNYSQTFGRSTVSDFTMIDDYMIELQKKLAHYLENKNNFQKLVQLKDNVRVTISILKDIKKILSQKKYSEIDTTYVRDYIDVDKRIRTIKEQQLGVNNKDNYYLTSSHCNDLDFYEKSRTDLLEKILGENNKYSISVKTS